MLSSWGRAFSLAVLSLHVTRAVADSFFDDALDALEDAITTVVSDALDDTDGILAQLNLKYMTKPPISSRLITSGLQSEVTVGLYCHSCENTVPPSAFDFASSWKDWGNSSWLGFALNSFDASFELHIDLSPGDEGDLTLSLLKLTPPKADGVAVEVDFQLVLGAQTDVAMSFKAGLDLSLNSSSAIMVPALDPVVQLDKSKKIGFDKSSFTLTPIFNASIPQPDFSLQLSLRTVFSVTFEGINIGALYLDLPAFNLTVNTLTNALSNCKTPPAGTPPDEIYSELIHMNGKLVGELSYEILDGGESGVLENWEIWDALDKCYAFFPSLGHLGAVPSTPTSALLTAPPITTCTTGGGDSGTTGTAAVGEALRSLSPGEKAGAIVGTLAGVTLVAALAFFAGRGDLNPFVQKAKTSTVRAAVPSLHAGQFKFGFFSRADRGAAGEYSSVTPGHQSWQTSGYGGGYSAPLSTEMQQQQSAYDGWRVFKQEPFVSVDEAEAGTSPPASGEVYQHGFFSPGPGETETPVLPQRNPSRYRGGQVEGLGLLQSPGWPVTQRDISRKPVPGQRL